MMCFVSGGMETEINGAGSPTKSASSGEGVGTSSQEVKLIVHHQKLPIHAEKEWIVDLISKKCLIDNAFGCLSDF